MSKTEATDHDGLFKELLSTFFIEFVELFLPGVAAYLDPDFAVVPMDKEILADLNLKERHEVDLLMKVKFKGEAAYFLVHVENQATAQSDFPSRMYSYFARLTLKHKLPIYPVVIFSYEMPLRPEPTYYEVTFPRKRILRFDYTVIQLNRLSWRKFVRRDNDEDRAERSSKGKTRMLPDAVSIEVGPGACDGNQRVHRELFELDGGGK